MRETEMREALMALRDLGLAHPVYVRADARCRAALQHETDREQRRRRLARNKTKSLVIAIAAVAAVGGATAAAESVLGGASSRLVHVLQTSPGFVSRAQATSIPADMARTYRVLARPQQVGDRPASAVLDPYGVAALGENASLSRRALTTATGEVAYVIPGNGAVCLETVPAVIHGCGPFPRVAANQMAGGTAVCSPGLPSNEIEIGGLLPSDATNVALHFNDRSTQPITLTNGVFIVDLPRTQPLPTSLTWTDTTGIRHSDTGTPGDAAVLHCAPGSHS